MHVLDLASALIKDGHELLVVVGEHGALVEQLQRKKINVLVVSDLTRSISLSKDFNCIFKIRKIIKSYKPDIIALHSSKAGLLGRLASIGTKIPVVFTVHGWSFAEGIPEFKRMIYILIEKFTAGFVDRFITVSQRDQQLALKYKITKMQKIVVVHNGIEIETSNNTSRLTNLRNDLPIRLISVARFSKQKDHETLLLALAKLKNYKWELTLVGGGDSINSVKELAVSLGLDEKIIFAGEVLNIKNKLTEYDIFLLISNWEGFPISILEAMAKKMPIIASDVGGVSESVIDGVTGFLIPRKDVPMLESALIKLFDDPGLRTSMGENAYQYLIENFTEDSMYEKTINVYKSLVKDIQ